MYAFCTNQRKWVISPLPFPCPPAYIGVIHPYMYTSYMYTFSTNQRQCVMSPLPFSYPPVHIGFIYVYMYIFYLCTCIHLVPIKDNG